jgi:ATP-binding cassette subfamily B (MDR/TAP) protein 1
VLYAVIFYCGAIFNRDYGLSLGDMFDALFSIMFAAFSVGQASMYIPDVGVCYVAAKSVFAILDLPSEAQ